MIDKSLIKQLIADDDIEKLEDYIKERKLTISDLSSNINFALDEETIFELNFISCSIYNTASNIFAYLLNNFSLILDVPNMVTTSNNPGENYNTLQIAVISDKTAYINSIINLRPNLINITDSNGMRLIHIAASLRNIDSFVHLINNRHANITDLCIFNRTPLYYAIKDSRLSIIEYAIDQRLININDPNGAGRNLSLLECAIGFKKTDIVQYLMVKGVAINQINIYGKKPIDIAYEKGANDIEVILQKANNNTKSEKRKYYEDNLYQKCTLFFTFLLFVSYCREHNYDAENRYFKDFFYIYLFDIVGTLLSFIHFLDAALRPEKTIKDLPDIAITKFQNLLNRQNSALHTKEHEGIL